jgi:ABC-type Fe3+/spermidine/putrescine transport system ATPase subunit
MLQISHLYKAFGTETVLEDLTFSLGEHEMLSILGRSGSGKTTLLKVLAGLEKPDRGEVLMEGHSILPVPPQKRGIVYLYQEPLLFPHLDVFGNIAFGLRLQKVPSKVLKARVNLMIEHLELEGQAQKMPHQLSGGQRQRVSFGRALIINPRVLLLDEPFGNLDTETRRNMQDLLKRIAKEDQITSIFVTHDLKEAILMGDRIGYMRQGRLEVYPDLQAFLADPETEAQGELAFWQGLGKDIGQ